MGLCFSKGVCSASVFASGPTTNDLEKAGPRRGASATPFALLAPCLSLNICVPARNDRFTREPKRSDFEADATGSHSSILARSFTQRRVVARSARMAARVATAVPVGRTARAAPRRRSRAARRRAASAVAETTANVATDAARRASRRLAGRPRRAIHIVRGEKLNLDVSGFDW